MVNYDNKFAWKIDGSRPSAADDSQGTFKGLAHDMIVGKSIARSLQCQHSTQSNNFGLGKCYKE